MPPASHSATAPDRPDGDVSKVVDPESVEPPAGETGRNPLLVGAGGVVLLGLVVALLAGQLVAVFETLLPASAEVRSRGSAFGSFDEVAPTIVRRTGLALAGAGAVMLIALRSPLDVRGAGRRWWPAGITVAIAAGWYGWLAYPHNAFPTNARIHWVDYLTWRSDTYFYAMGRLPHLAFYEVPHLWQALNAAIVVALAIAICRQIGLSWTLSSMLASVILFGGNFLLFADTAEDVFLNFALILGLILAVLRRHPVAIGVMLAATILGRPSFLVLIPCVPAAEFVYYFRQTRSVRRAITGLPWRWLGTMMVTALAVTVAAQVMFSILGDRYFLTGGRLIDTGPLAAAEAQAVDGFTISRLSGTYVLHNLWMMPAVALVAALFALVGARRFRSDVEVGAYFLGIGWLAVLFVHEWEPLVYYNVRYFTYTVPFVLVLSWFAVSHPRIASDRVLSAGLVGALLFSAVVIPSSSFDARNNRLNRPEVELSRVDEQLSDLVGDRPVYLTFGGRSTQNYLAYVLRRNRSSIQQIGDDDVVTDGGVVISMRAEPWADDPVLETPSLLVFETGATVPDNATAGESP